MVKETIEITGKVNSDELKKEFKDVQKQVNKTTDSVEDFSKKSKKDLKGVEKQTKKTNKGVGLVSKGFKALGTAMKAAGIGLVVAAVVKLTQAFMRNQKILDGVSSVFETINIVFSQITTAITDAFEAANKATGGFDALGKVMSGLLTIAVTPLKIAFNGLKLAVLQTQLAWEKSVFGDGDKDRIKELNEGIKQTRLEVLQAGVDAVEAGKQVVNNFSEAVGEVGTLAKETTKELKEVSVSAANEQAKELIEARKQAEINAALIEKSIFKSQLAAEKQRQIRDNETLSFKKRREANEKLGKILEKQQENELKLAQERLKAAELEVEAGNTSTAAKVAVINAEKELLDIKERIAGFESEQQLNRNALNREELEATNSQKQALSELSFEKQRAAAEEIENERLRLQTLKEIAVEEREFELERLQEKINNTNAETSARIEAENEYAQRKFELNQQIKESDKALTEFEKKNKQLELENEKKVQQQKLALTQQTLGAVTQILGQNSKAGKAAAIAQAAINTYQGVTQVWKNETTLPEPFGTIQKIASTATVLASGLKSVQQIKSTKLPSLGGGGGASVGGGSVSASAAQAQAVAPSFNIVGDTGTNQIADVLGRNAERPTRAYVVSREVSTQQELDRNINESATLG